MYCANRRIHLELMQVSVYEAIHCANDVSRLKKRQNTFSGTLVTISLTYIEAYLASMVARMSWSPSFPPLDVFPAKARLFMLPVCESQYDPV